MCPIFVIKFSGVSDLQGVKVPVFPLTLLIIVTTVLRYRAACDNTLLHYLSVKKIENQSIFGEDMDKNLRLTFLAHPAYKNSLLVRTGSNN